VYAVTPADGPPTPTHPSLALKRTVGPDPDRLAAAAQEADAAAAAGRAGPSTLPLLAAGRDGDAAAFHVLTPLAAGGDLGAALATRAAARLAGAGFRVDGPPPSARLAAATGALPPRLALGLLAQAAAGVAAVHAAGLVHCDVKPQNLLLMEAGGLSTEDEAADEPTAAAAHEEEGEEDEEAASAASLRASGAGSSRPSTRPPSAAAPVGGGGPAAAASLPTLVLADFGSARPAPLPLPTRAAALALAEWADAHTSPAFRPPELYDPPSGPGAAITPAVDVWGLGCVLYFMLAGGVTPFERGNGGPAGGSLALAVLAGRVSWPDQGYGGGQAAAAAAALSRRVAAARALAEACLAADPADRPTAAEVAARSRALAR